MLPSLKFGRDAQLFITSSVVGSFAGSINGLYFNLYLRALGYGQDLIGALTSVSAFVVMGMSIGAGYIAGRISYRRLLISGMLLQAGGWILPLLIPETFWLFLAAFLGGVGGSLVGVVGAPLLVELAREGEREKVFGIQSGFSVFANTAGSALAGVLPGILAPLLGLLPETAELYRSTMLLSFFLFLLAFVPVLFLPAGRGSSSLKLRELCDHKAFVAKLVAINGLIGLGAGLVLPFVNLFFRLKFQVPDHKLGLIFSLNSLLIGIGNLSSPLLARRFGRIRAVVFSQGSSIPFFFLWGYAPTASLAILGYLIRTALMNLAGPLFSVAVMEAVPRNLRSGVNALSMVFWNGGWALGSLISGFVQVRCGFAPLFPLPALLYTVAIWITLRAFKVRESPHSSQA